MKFKNYTFVVLSERNEMRSYSFSIFQFIHRVLIVMSIVIVGGICFSYALHDIQSKVNRIKMLEVEKQNLFREIQQYHLREYYKEIRNRNNESHIANNYKNLNGKGIGGDEFIFNEDMLSTGNRGSFKSLLIRNQDHDVDFSLAVNLCLAYVKLRAHLQARQKQLVHTPSILPYYGVILSGFGYRISPFTEKKSLHRGIDIACEIGTPVLATAAGTVIDISENALWGLNCTIDHGDGIKTQYGHLSKILVKKGSEVSRWQVIAKSGQSGQATGPHLHYQIWIEDTPVNPMLFITKEEKKKEGA